MASDEDAHHLAFKAVHWEAGDLVVAESVEDEEDEDALPHEFVVHAYGRRVSEDAACCCVHAPFHPFFFLEVGLAATREFLDALLAQMKAYLGRVMVREFRGFDLVRRTNFVGACATPPSGFCRLEFASLRAARKARSWATHRRPDLRQFEANVDPLTRALHAVKAEEPCGGTLHVRFDAADREREDRAECRITRCPVERWVTDPSKFVSAPASACTAKRTGVKVASFDIECYSAKGEFPDAAVKDDVIITICTTFTSSSRPSRAVAVVLGEVRRPPKEEEDVEVICAPDEAHLLAAWASTMAREAPDVLVGYNIWGFDMRYVHKRVLMNGGVMNPVLADFFGCLGRSATAFASAPDLVQRRIKCGGAMSNDASMLVTPGILQLDLYYFLRRFHAGLESYKLGEVSRTFLGAQESKTGLGIREMFELWREGTAEQKWPIVEYCVRDAELVALLLERVGALTGVTEMANVCRVAPDTILQQGEQTKVLSLILARTSPAKMLCPSPPGAAAFQQRQQYPRSRPQQRAEEEEEEEEAAEKLQGAMVLEPRVGAYWTPVVCLDFQSLYPSIMMAHNLCHSTLCPSSAAAREEEGWADVEGQRVATPARMSGVLPDLLRDLQKKRMETRALLKTTADPHVAAVLDARQLAYKVSMNSVYGFCGVGGAAGLLPCREVAATVTAVGRGMLLKTKAFIEEACGGRVLYGDTDSLMVDFAGAASSAEECTRRGMEAAEKATALFSRPVKLCFEKCYLSYVLFSKKRYMGLVRRSDAATTTPRGERERESGTLDCKGVQFVRRDMCAFAKAACTEVVYVMLRMADAEAAVRLAQEHVRRLVMPASPEEEVPLEDLVITKSIKHGSARILADVDKNCLRCGGRGTCRSPAGKTAIYALRCTSCGAEREVAYRCTSSPVIHVALRKERRSNGAEGYRSGDLVPFVYVAVREESPAKRARATSSTAASACCEKAYDPEDVREDGGATLRVDHLFYYEHQVKGVLLDVFQPLFPDEPRDRLETRLFGELVAHAKARNGRQSTITSFFRVPPSS